MRGRSGAGWLTRRAVARSLCLLASAELPHLLGLATPTHVAAQAPPVELTRLTAPIELDGMPYEAAWQDIPALPLTMYYPTFRGTPAQRTEIRVAYDDDHFYAAGWFFDSEPEGIRVHSLYRDRWNGDDALAIYLDVFNDNQNAKWFGITPAAMRFDLLVTDDGRSLNDSWDGFWDARTTVTDEGWFVEVRIPFSTLGFQTGPDDRTVMGLTVTRLVSRTGERVTFPAIDPQFAFRQPSVAQDVVLRGVATSRPVYLTPFVVGGVGRVPRLNEAGTAYTATSDHTREAGLDLRYALSSTMTLDLTANTDFAQVEADEQQVNLNRFSLFFPEKRRFFQEGSGVFDFATGDGSRLFHSRRIGITGANEQVPVVGGARIVGRAGEWDVGALSMQTDDVAGLPTENFSVARMRRRAFNDFSYLGAMLTTRIRDGGRNLAAGVDGTVRVVGDTYATLKWSATDDRDDGSPSLGDRSHLHAAVQRRASRGLAYDVNVTRSGSAYTPAMGFLPRRDYTSVNLLANHYVFTDDHAVLRRVFPGLLAFSTFRNGDGSLESGTYAVWVQWETKAGGGGWLEPKLFIEDVAAPFPIGGDVTIPAGRYEYADFQAVYSMPSGDRLRTQIDARAGTFFDGTRVQLIARPTWNVSRHLEIGADYQWSRLRFQDRGEGTDIHLARLRIRTAADSRASGNAFVQLNSTTDRLDFNVRLRYNFAEGRDLWVVYNEGLATERAREAGTPAPPRSLARALVLKYTHTLGS